MRKYITKYLILILFELLLVYNIIYGRGHPAYPIILIHGLNSSYKAWDQLTSDWHEWYGWEVYPEPLNVCLNYDANPTQNNMYGDINTFFDPNDIPDNYIDYDIFRVNFSIGPDGLMDEYTTDEDYFAAENERYFDVYQVEPSYGTVRTEVRISISTEEASRFHLYMYIVFPDIPNEYYQIYEIDNTQYYNITLNLDTNNDGIPDLPDPADYNVNTGKIINLSNEESIYKQGKTLKDIIRFVLNQTGKEKVILIGHSMGGLCIREYLQRINNGEHINWVNPSLENGHMIKRVTTISTPHLGSNAGEDPLTGWLEGWYFKIDDKSNAVRDLKYEYTSGDNIPALYLFSGDEDDPNFLDEDFYSHDVNNNGNLNDYISGISYETYANPNLPLPNNIKYTWITAKWLYGGDMIVKLSRQWLYDLNNNPSPFGITDTLLMDGKDHGESKEDSPNITRGIDEPNQKDLAYEIEINKNFNEYIHGTTTFQTYYNDIDADYFKFVADDNEIAYVEVDSIYNTEYWQLTIFNENEEEVVKVTNEDNPGNKAFVKFNISKDNIYYILFTSKAIENSYMHPYVLKAQTFTVEDGLVAYWSFDDGTAIDSSGNGHNGDIYGNPSIVQGKYGSALEFGEGKYVEVPVSSLLKDFTAGPHTYSCWIKPSTNITDWCYILECAYPENGGDLGDQRGIRFEGGRDRPTFKWVTDENSYRILANSSCSSNVWRHIVGVYDGINGYIYIDGQRENSKESQGSGTQISNFFIAITDGGKYPFHGVIDEIKLYNRALTEDEITNLYIYNDQSLPVTLISFTAKANSNKIILEWTTESEINNLGFEILRSLNRDSGYVKIATYKTNPNLIGAGSSSYQHEYKFEDPSVELNTLYWYKLIDVDFSGNKGIHGPVSAICSDKYSSLKPEKFYLYQNYPNPFNGSTLISFDLPEDAIVKLNIYNSYGQKVETLVDKKLSKGNYQLLYDRKNLPSGVYYYQILAKGFQSVRKMLIIK